MIEINLLPGAAKKAKGRGAGLSLGTLAADLRARIKDPYMIAAVVTFVVATAGIGFLHLSQQAREAELTAREEKAVADSMRYATILRERRRAEAKRDSVLRQLEVIQSIDNYRYVWPHILDEISRALPPYTWLKSVATTTPPSVASQAPPAAPPGPAPAPTPGTPGAPGAQAAPPPKQDPSPNFEPLRFRLVGNTVDMQALTRFIRLLEASPFIQNVQLARSELAMVDGKEVTEFQVDAQYERPDKSVITTAPVQLSVR
jgi:Tfp pilus assembly protein PilN